MEHVNITSLVGGAVKIIQFQLVLHSTRILSMSEYLKSLDKDATARYPAKLDLFGSKETDDPFAS